MLVACHLACNCAACLNVYTSIPSMASAVRQSKVAWSNRLVSIGWGIASGAALLHSDLVPNLQLSLPSNAGKSSGSGLAKADKEFEDDLEDLEADSDDDEPAPEMAMPIKFQAAIMQMLLESSSEKPVKLADLKMPEGEDPAQFAMFFWQQGYICTK